MNFKEYLEEASKPVDKNLSIDKKIAVIGRTHQERQQKFNEFEHGILSSGGDKSKIAKAKERLEAQRKAAEERVKELRASKGQ